MSANAPSQTVFSIGYDFHVGNGTSGTDNGNVWGITNYKDQSRNQSFAYDGLNRLTSAQNAGTNCAAGTVNGKTEYWGNSYGYDPWGNLTNKTITKCGAELLNAPALVNNQLSGYGYDAAGNMTSDPTDNVTSTYDAENRIATASTPPGVFTYAYDADGNRVEKSGGGSGTLYWYMTPGIVAESDLAGNLKSEYLFFNGERAARRDFDPSTHAPTGVFYYFSDHLKTASVIADSAGNIKSESDYYPWGGELQFVNNDSNHYKFTGKERDTESGLDYFGARYYSNGLGRFITPDWAEKATAVPYAEFVDPQSLNLYSYVRNIPTVSVDVDGHCDWCKDALDFSTGVVQGIVASASWGTVGAPKSNDSNASLAGQLVGTAIEGGISTDLAMQGGGSAIAGVIAAPETGGLSLVGTAVGGTEALVGAAGAIGAGKNYGAIINTMSRRAGDFKTSTREGAIQNNAEKNGGTNKCERCGKDLQRTQNKKGQTPPKNQLHVHHDPPIKDGGGKDSKAEVVCRDCHQTKIHGKDR